MAQTLQNIYELIKQDHMKTRELLEDLVSLDAEDAEGRDELLQDIRDDLIPHARAEEAVFYNSIRSLTDETDKVMHGYKEHAEAEAILRSLQLMEKAGIGWKAGAEKLQETLLHHMKEEETEIFKLARKVLSDDEAKAIGSAFKKMKPEIREDGLTKNTADFVANLLPPRLKTALGGEPPVVDGK